MNSLQKNLKKSCIACLFVGLVVLIVGISDGLVEAFDVDAIATIFCGLGAAPTGVQTSRLANVPSNATKIRSIGLVVLLGSIVFAGVAVWQGNPSVVQLVALGAMIITALLMVVFAQQLAKYLERV